MVQLQGALLVSVFAFAFLLHRILYSQSGIWEFAYPKRKKIVVLTLPSTDRKPTVPDPSQIILYEQKELL